MDGTHWPLRAGTPPLWAHQEAALARSRDLAAFAFHHQPGLGKEQPTFEPVLTPSGWRCIGDLVVGDPIIGADGQTYHVTGVFPQGVKPVWRVSFRDRTEAFCGEEHLWRVQHRQPEMMGGWRTMTTAMLMSFKICHSAGGYYWRIPVADPAIFPIAKLRLPPYALGALIGDGSLTLHTARIAAPSHKLSMISDVIEDLSADGFMSMPRYTPPSLNENASHVNILKLISKIKSIGLAVHSSERFIPQEYFLGSIEQRTCLLAGLMDTDGSIGKENSVIFSTTSYRLSADVASLVRSLGGIATVKSYARKKCVEFKVTIKTKFCPFRHHRHRARWRPHKLVRYITAIEPTGESVEQVCISVSAPDKLYITRDYVVTHNTATVISEAGRFFLDGEIDTLIVVAPNRVHQQWVLSAFPTWAGYPWKGFAWPKGGLSSQRRKAAFEANLRLSDVKPSLRVFTFNYENFRMPHGTQRRPAPVPATLQLIDRIIETSKAGVYLCLDEQHRTKSFNSQQTRAALRYGRGVVKVRRGLTGTPILQGVHDLWSQYAFLDPLIIGEPNFYSFRSRYCKTRALPSRPNVLIIEGAKNVDELTRKIAPFTSTVKKEDALDLPPKLFLEPFMVEMEPAQERAYLQMEEVMLTGLRQPDGTAKIITAQIVLTQLQKLLMIASGFIMDENKEVHWISDSKVDAIREVIEDLAGECCVVWAPWVALLDRLSEVLPNATRFRDLSDLGVWAKRGGPLVANPASGGVGVDGMQVHAHRAFYAGNSFSLEHRLQSVDRIHRGEQKKTCFYQDFVSLGTKDAVVLKALAMKEDVGNMTVEKLKKLLLAGENEQTH